MNRIFSIVRKFGLGPVCVLALGATANAMMTNQEFMINNNATNDWSRWSYVDFATTTIAGHAGIPTSTFGGNAGVRFKFLQLDNGNTLNNTQCFEVMTGAPTFLPGTVSDTRLWIVTGLGSFANPRGLNDDIDLANNNRYSRARVYLKGAPGSFVVLAVAAYDAVNWNNIHFNLVVNQLPLSEAACTTGQALPWVKLINGNMTISNNAF
jgi:hypothetical protein